MTAPQITTERLVLTRLRADDAAAVFAYRSLPEVYRYQTWEPRSLDDAVRFIEDLTTVDFDTPGTWFQFGICLRDSGELIGDLGVHFVEDGRQAEIGVTLSPRSQGRGLGAEAVTAVIEYLFGRLDKHRVFASVDPRNEPSLRLLRRVGMQQEAHFRLSLLFKGEWADDVVYAALASEWQGARRGPATTSS